MCHTPLIWLSLPCPFPLPDPSVSSPFPFNGLHPIPLACVGLAGSVAQQPHLHTQSYYSVRKE